MARGAGVLVGAGVRVPVADLSPVVVLVFDVVMALGLGVVVLETEAEGNLDFFCEEGIGVRSLEAGLGSDEASDTGGEGGSESPGVSFLGGGRDISSGGVEISGELAVERGEFSKVGDPGIEMSVEMTDKWRFSAFLTLSCRMSASTLRSDNSSRNLCASILSVSRSFSPILTSSSIMTLLSIAWLYFDSRSSSEEVVWRACRSKSSLATSISRNFI